MSLHYQPASTLQPQWQIREILHLSPQLLLSRQRWRLCHWYRQLWDWTRPRAYLRRSHKDSLAHQYTTPVPGRSANRSSKTDSTSSCQIEWIGDKNINFELNTFILTLCMWEGVVNEGQRSTLWFLSATLHKFQGLNFSYQVCVCLYSLSYFSSSQK